MAVDLTEVNYILLKADGSVLAQNMNYYIQQGNVGDKIFFGSLAALNTDVGIAVCTLPNGEQTTVAGVYDTCAYQGSTIGGFLFTLTSNETNYYGGLMMALAIYRSSTRLVSYPLYLVINETGLMSDTNTGVTVEEINTYLQQLENFPIWVSTFYVPYTGATQDVDLGVHKITANGIQVVDNKRIIRVNNNNLLIGTSEGDIVLQPFNKLYYGSYEVAVKHDLENYVPYSGATQDVDLGSAWLKTAGIQIEDNYHTIELVSGNLVIGTGSGNIALRPDNNLYLSGSYIYLDSDTSWKARLDTESLSADRQFEFPDDSGEIALTKNVVPYSGATQDVNIGNHTFNAQELFVTSNNFKLHIYQDENNIDSLWITTGIGSIILNPDEKAYYAGHEIANKNDIANAISNVYKYKGAKTVAEINSLGTSAENGDVYNVTNSGTLTQGSVSVIAGDNVAWDSSNSRWDKLAGSVDLSGYVPYIGATNDLNLGTHKLEFADSLNISNSNGDLYFSGSGSYLFYGDDGNADLTLSELTQDRVYRLPDASGTFALVGDLANYVDLTSTQTITGTKTFKGDFKFVGASYTNEGVLTTDNNYAYLGYDGANTLFAFNNQRFISNNVSGTDLGSSTRLWKDLYLSGTINTLLASDQDIADIMGD